MYSLKSLIYLIILLVCLHSSYASRHYGKPEPQYEEPPQTQDDDDDNGSPMKTCEMVCRARPKTGKRDWARESFWTILSGVYTCRWQQLGKTLLDNTAYADIVIDFFDDFQTNNKTRFAHSSILSYVSDKLRMDVERAIDIHVTNYSRPRERLPSIRWPPLPTQAVDSLLEYIYTNRMTNFDPSKNIIGLYVAAFTADHKELMTMIENYLDDAFYTVEQLNQLVHYLRYAHKNNFIQLKNVLVVIARKILKMTEQDFDKFIRDICESSGYTRTWQTLPGGGVRPGEVYPEIRSRPEDENGFGEGISISGVPGSGITGGTVVGGGRHGGGIGHSATDAHTRQPLSSPMNLVEELKDMSDKEHKRRNVGPYDAHP